MVGACSGGNPGVVATSAAPGSQAPPGSQTPQGSAGRPSEAATLATVRLQLQWYPQAQFAGYFAAIEQGYYAAENLDVHWLSADRRIAPQTVGSAVDGPEFTVAWQPQVLQAREGGSQLVNIAQVFQRSGTLSVSWKDADITEPSDFKGKRVGVLGFGSDLEVAAGTRKVGLRAGTDYETVNQDFDMAPLLSREVDVAEAMIYDGYAQSPDTGQLFEPADFNVINWNDEESAMLQDALFARADWLARPGNEAIAVRFLKASFQGWIYCRDNPAACVQYTIKAGPKLGAGHQAWMLNEVDPLIWPSPNGIGLMDEALWSKTVGVSVEAGIIAAAPPADAYRTDLAQAALAALADADTRGASFVKGAVDVTPGGS